ncbi:MAG: hypothetical protein LBK57_03335 [Clostridiales Family XIII bacterium]|jgi:hypothetical protein|nr:hypothetical protein [Clostridiales Family XIII bacterium]
MKKYMRVFVPIALLLFGCLFAANASAAENADESTSGGAVSMPDTPPQIAPEESPTSAVLGAQNGIIDVALPDEVPFDILIFSDTGTGVVLSSEFRVANNSDFPVNVTIRDAYVNIANEDSFSVRSDENLPEEGNNIYIDMICDAGGESAHTVIGAEPGGENFVFALDGGASGTFRFEGAVNEYGDIKWEETSIMIFLSFEIDIPASDIISALVPVVYPIDEDVSAAEENTEEIVEDAPDGQEDSTYISDSVSADNTSPESEETDVNSPTDDDPPVLESAEKNEQSNTVNAEDITPGSESAAEETTSEQSQDARKDDGAEKL